MSQSFYVWKVYHHSYSVNSAEDGYTCIIHLALKKPKNFVILDSNNKCFIGFNSLTCQNLVN